MRVKLKQLYQIQASMFLPNSTIRLISCSSPGQSDIPHLQTAGQPLILYLFQTQFTN